MKPLDKEKVTLPQKIPNIDKKTKTPHLKIEGMRKEGTNELKPDPNGRT